MQLATLAELKAHLNMPSSSSVDDDELELVLYAAQDVVTNLAGDYSDASITETVPVSGGTALLSRRPSGDVLDVQGAAVSGVNRPAGVINFLSPYIDRITVTYDTGTGFPPYAIRLACLIIAKHLWETQRGAQPLPIQGNQDDQLTDTSVYAPGIPARARVLLEPFARGPQVA